MRNPFKKYYFMTGENGLKKFDCTNDIWLWRNPQDAVTVVLNMWEKQYGRVTIRSVMRI